MLIHGYGSNERDLFSLIDYFPIDSYVISLRAPKELFNDSYAWYDIYLDSNNKFYDHDAAARVRDELFHFIDDLSKLITNAFGLAQNATGEIENAVKGLLDRYLADKGLVTREEYEVLKEMHSELQNEVHSLRKELNTLKPKTRSIKANTSNKNK